MPGYRAIDSLIKICLISAAVLVSSWVVQETAPKRSANTKAETFSIVIMIAFLHVWSLCGTVGSCLAVLLVWSSAVEAATLTGQPLVLDADTVIMSGERIRLKGIDAPETTQRCLDAEQQSYPCGQVATNALIDKIGISPLTCVGDTRDRYTRLLATCFLDDLDVNDWLVQHGYALAYRKYSTHYVAEEEKAKALKRGVWSGTFTPPWEWRRQP